MEADRPLMKKSSLIVTSVALAIALLAHVRADAEEPKPAEPPWFVDQRRIPPAPQDGEAAGQAQNPADAALEQEAEEQRRRLEELSQKLKADELRLREREAEAQRKAEELHRLTEQAAEQLRAEEERIRAGHADAAAKAAELERLAREAEAKRKREEELLSAAQAEIRKQVEELKRVSEEAEAKRKELDEKNAAEAARREGEAAAAKRDEDAAPAKTAEPEGTPAQNRQEEQLNIPAIAVDCPEPKVSSSAMLGGRAKISSLSKCRTGQHVRLSYGSTILDGTFDADGTAEIALDMFMGHEIGAALTFADETTVKVALPAGDLGDVTKVAVLWQAPVNIDLHAFEYAAAFDDPGHVWAQSPRDAAGSRALMAQDARGHGFLSTTGDAAQTGAKAEVYTFWNNTEQRHGAVAMAVDFETRGDTPSGAMCGNGQYASLPIDIIVRKPDGQMRKQSGILAPAPCGAALTGTARYMSGLVPDLRIRN